MAKWARRPVSRRRVLLRRSMAQAWAEYEERINSERDAAPEATVTPVESQEDVSDQEVDNVSGSGTGVCLPASVAAVDLREGQA